MLSFDVAKINLNLDNQQLDAVDAKDAKFIDGIDPKISRKKKSTIFQSEDEFESSVPSESIPKNIKMSNRSTPMMVNDEEIPKSSKGNGRFVNNILSVSRYIDD